MSNFVSDKLLSGFFVSFGAVLGAWLRMKVTRTFERIQISKKWGILTVNILATFLLGFVLALLSKNINLTHTSLFYLFVCVGFLGSLSTFSTFIFEFMDVLRKRHWLQGLYFGLASLIGGFLAAASGYGIGNG